MLTARAATSRTATAETADSANISAFARRDGEVFHTYSCYGRGIDAVNGAYQLLDLTAKGRDEGGLEWPMAWLHRHDAYPDAEEAPTV